MIFQEPGNNKEGRAPHVAVIGAGASGMMAAIAAAGQGARVTLLERNARPGKKLLITGNGRCNLTHLDDGLWERYHSSDQEALKACCSTLRSEMDVSDTLAFFRRLGLLTTQKDGYVYPLSNSSESVLYVLEREMERLGVKRKYAGKVTGLEYSDSHRRAPALVDKSTDTAWKIQTESYAYTADRVILAAGSKACPDTGSDGSGYELARQVGHTIIEPVPSLTAFKSSLKGLEKAAGCRCMARVTASDPETGEAVSDAGQVQWNKDGIAGIVVFQVSGFVAERLKTGKQVLVKLDLLPEMEQVTAEAFFKGQSARPDNVKGLLKGILPEKLSLLISQLFLEDIDKTICVKEQNKDAAERLAAFMKNMSLPVTGVRGFEHAQVCRGGVALHEIDTGTFESRLKPGLFFAGEILDADGPCGGYNLQWAWSSGYVAGHAGGITDAEKIRIQNTCDQRHTR